MNRGVVLGILLSGFAWFAQDCAAASSSDSSDDGTQKTYYWQGNQLNNLGRLSAGYTDFEDVQHHAKTGRDADQYLSTIREQLAHQAAADSQQRNAMDFSGQLAGNPLEVIYGASGVQVILHADMLFDESTASPKAGAEDVLERLCNLLQRETQKEIHLLIADRLEDGPNARNLDAERSLVILTGLEWPKQPSSRDN